MINKTETLNDIKTAYMTKLENLFISKYNFVGDETFDINAQTLFFRTIFREGHVAVINLLENKKSIQRYYPNIKMGQGIGNNGVVESAYIFPAWLNFSGDKYESFANFIQYKNGRGIATQDVQNNKIVFFQNFIGEDIINYKSIKQLLEPFIDELARRHLQASLYNVVAGGKIASSSSHSINNQIESNLYSVGETLKFDSSYSNDSATFNMAEIVSDNISVIPFNLDPNVFLDCIPKYEAIIYKIFGFRINQRFKKERMLTGEMKYEEHEFNGFDFRLRQSYKNFANNYKKMFNIDLDLVDNLADDSNDDPDKKAENVGGNDE